MVVHKFSFKEANVFIKLGMLNHNSFDKNNENTVFLYNS